MTDTLQPPINPDCVNGKHHPVCSGTAWDQVADDLTHCRCECHAGHDPAADLISGVSLAELPAADSVL